MQEIMQFVSRQINIYIVSRSKLIGLTPINIIKNIQRNKRFNFWMNAGGMKLSTIHSFKGWEINTLFLIIDGIFFI